MRIHTIILPYKEGINRTKPIGKNDMKSIRFRGSWVRLHIAGLDTSNNPQSG